MAGLSQAAAQQLVAAAQAIESGGPDLAAARLAPVLASHPSHPEVLRVQAGILNLRGDYRSAASLMRRAIQGRPEDALYYNTLGSILGSASEFDAAIAALRRACELQPDLAIAWFNLGVMLTRSVRHAEAIEALQRAIALDPRYMPARALMGDMLRAESRVAEASAEYRRMIAEQPWAGMAWWGLADLKTIRFEHGDIEHMQRAMRDPRAGDEDRIAIGFALAKALDDQGRYPESLDSLAQANAIARRRMRWNAESFSAGITHILNAFTPAPRGAGNESLGREVIFVPSLPRSGSTLVEQILASHSAVEGPGELPDLPLTLAEETRRRGKPLFQCAAEMQPADWQRLGERYLERTARWRAERPVSTDKLPGNWYYIGAIRAMLPGAKIIACRRDPLETCFSCYRQRLDGNEYTRTFEDLAAYWHDYDRAIRHWHAMHPENVHEHVYEALIEDPESSIRSLLDFCGLPFEEACLQFHRTDRDVRTPSAMQVRQPLRRDTARAPRYGALLDPLRRALGLPAFGG
ncbi:MAG TPA: sulfotransferase [Rhodanobacteraceae bacterium]|nr:sulfotransferase [Rhodanobacteraceae bacterium]